MPQETVVTDREPLSYRQVVVLALPIVFANLAVPLLGIVDTAVIGNLGSAAPLGAIAIGSQIFAFLFWGMGFLRMGTTGLTAQADGAGNAAEVLVVLLRSLVLGVLLGALLVLVQNPIATAANAVFRTSPEVAAMAREYFLVRIWGAPATLASYAAIGWFIGLRRTRLVLLVQVFMNALNITLDLLFVVGFGWGVKGVALGTLISEWATVLLALALIIRIWRGEAIEERGGLRRRILEPQALLAMFDVNRDIFLRTLLLIGAFAWFTRQGAQAGETILAANYLLLQFLTFSAFFLDGFAFSTEALVGQAVGARNRSHLTEAVRKSSVLAVVTALFTTVVFAVAGPAVIDLLTNALEVRSAARTFLVYAVLHPLIAVWCFQLDGVFIGATRTADMRNTMLVSFAVFLAAWWFLQAALGNHGLWLSFLFFFVLRGVTLGLRYPELVRATTDEGAR